MNQPNDKLWLPSVDGLRFVGFSLVFIHHLPNPPNNSILLVLHERGWVGVEIFFAISSFLLFRLFQQEWLAAGRIDVPKFYFRRFLRIYPLMMCVPVLLMVWTSQYNQIAVGRILGLGFFVDNFITWIYGFQTAISFTAHLWTLSFEFQIYLLLPAVFVLFISYGRRSFFIYLTVFFCIALGARASFVLANMPHPIVWVTPFLRPESVLVGIALAVGGLWSLPVSIALAILVMAISALIWLPNVTEIGLSTLVLYPICSVISGTTLFLSLKAKPVIFILSSQPLRFLGKISFGLYVFHLPAIAIVTKQMVTWGYIQADATQNYCLRFVVVFLMTVLAATISYYCFERPFLKLKQGYRHQNP